MDMDKLWNWLLDQGATRVANIRNMNKAHPYHPSSARITNYQANELPLWITGSAFAAVIVAFVGIGSYGLGKMSLNKSTHRRRASLSFGDQSAICWFLLCGFLHCFFEAYYVLNYKTLASKQTLFAQLWKEYSLSDSRYLSQDLFVLTIESLTVLTLGPLSFLTAILTSRGSNHRYLAQAVISSMHLFSVALYYSACFITEHVSGYGFSRPEFLYYWVYFIGFNAPWVLVPVSLLYRSAREIKKTFDLAEGVRLGSLRSTGRITRDEDKLRNTTRKSTDNVVRGEQREQKVRSAVISAVKEEETNSGSGRSTEVTTVRGEDKFERRTNSVVTEEMPKLDGAYVVKEDNKSGKSTKERAVREEEDKPRRRTEGAVREREEDKSRRRTDSAARKEKEKERKKSKWIYSRDD